jgi:phospholipid/cholesterol/gamma-HCH transport system substrate-binding protein
MKGRLSLELLVGLFMVIGIACLSYLSIRLGKMDVLGQRGYPVYAVFSNIGGLRSGAPVEMAGVDIGRVRRISLENYEARVVLEIQDGLVLQEDAIASIKTRGLIGERYIQITVGAADATIQPGGRIRQTEPAVDLESLIGKYMFGKM